MPSNQKRKGPSKGKRAQQPKQNAYASARAPTDDGEIFAVVTKFFGGATVEVMCSDGKERLCIIRRKFRGRHKRSNEVSAGSLILIGLYDWTTPSTSASSVREKCDLLCVYSNEQTRTFSKEGHLVPALLPLLGVAAGPTRGGGDDHFEFRNELPTDAEFADLEDSENENENESDCEDATSVSAILNTGNKVLVEDI